MLLPYNLNPEFNPGVSGKYSVEKEITDWNIPLVNLPEYSSAQKDLDKIQIILDFSQKLMNNSKNLDSEYVDIVNKYFWDLV